MHAAVAPLSATLVAVALGLVLSVSGRVPEAARPGLGVASRQVLRVGVALLGLQLVLGDVLALGWPLLLVIAGVVGLGIGGTLTLGARLGVPPERALLVACGFSICGAAAVAAVEGVRSSAGRDAPGSTDGAGTTGSTGSSGARDAATVVSLVVVFGSVSMLVLPLTALALGLSPTAVGAWSGASIQEVGQVVVAGGIAGGTALQVAVAVKLGRVLMLAPVLATISYRSRRTAAVRPPLVPGFVAVFVVLALVRGVTPAPLLDVASAVQAAALAMAMFALGCSLDRGVLRSTGRPLLLLAAGATLLVALLGLPAVLVTG